MLSREPRRHRIRRRADNDGNARRLRGPERPLDMREIKDAVLRLLAGPRGFRNADHIDVRRPHHFHVLLQPLIGHVLVVVRDAV